MRELDRMDDMEDGMEDRRDSAKGVVLIVGGEDGIAVELAHAFAEKQWNVGVLWGLPIHASGQDDATEIVAHLDAKERLADVVWTHFDDAERVVKQVTSYLGSCDAVVMVAARSPWILTDKAGRGVLDACIGVMRSCGANGRFVLVTPYPEIGPDTAVAAVHPAGLAALAAPLQRWPDLATHIVTGPYPHGPDMRPEVWEIAQAVVWLCDGAPDGYTGTRIKIIPSGYRPQVGL
jgi:hypothetical protein